MNKEHICLVSFLVIWCFSCQDLLYEPTAKHESGVRQPVVNIIIQPTEESTRLLVWGNVEVQYSMDLKDHHLQAVNCYLDTLLMASTTDQETILFDSRVVEDGNYIFTLELLTTTDSGSLADKAGMEFMFYSVQWPMTVQNSTRHYRPNITHAAPLDGRLSLAWKMYPHSNFRHYEIIEIKDEVEITRAIIPTRTDTMWSDSLYIGGSSQYRVLTYAADALIPGNVRKIDFALPRVEYTQPSFANRPELIIQWHGTPFTNNLQHYEVQCAIVPSTTAPPYDTSGIDFFTMYSTSNPQDTVQTLTSGFGNLTLYRVATHSESGDCFFSESYPVLIGFQIAPHRRVKYSPQFGAFYLMPPLATDGPAYRISDYSYNVFAFTSIHIDVNRDGSRVFGVSDTSLMELDPESLQKISSVPVDGLWNGGVHHLDGIRASTGSILYFTGYDASGAPDRSYSFDYDAQILHGSTEINLQGKGPFLHVAGNNQFATLQPDILVQRSGNSWKRLRSVDTDRFCFVGDGDTCITADNSVLTLRETASFTALRTVSVGHPLKYPCYDRSARNIGVMVNGSEYQIYTIPEFNLDKQIALFLQDTTDKILLSNGTLFSSRGYVFPINYPDSAITGYF